MKNIILSTIFFITLSCTAQNPIVARYTGNGTYGDISNAYYKDIDHFLDPYVGTWLHTNGTTSLKIVLKKIESVYMLYGRKAFYTDFIVGEYQYIENGVVKLNTLNNLRDYSDPMDYNLHGNILIPNNIYPQCHDCTVGEKRLSLATRDSYSRNVSGLEARMIMRRITENGVVKIKLIFNQTSGSHGITNDGEPTNIDRHILPYGDYILIKQL